MSGHDDWLAAPYVEHDACDCGQPDCTCAADSHDDADHARQEWEDTHPGWDD